MSAHLNTYGGINEIAVRNYGEPPAPLVPACVYHFDINIFLLFYILFFTLFCKKTCFILVVNVGLNRNRLTLSFYSRNKSTQTMFIAYILLK